MSEHARFGHPGACAFWHERVLILAGYQELLLERPTARTAIK